MIFETFYKVMELRNFLMNSFTAKLKDPGFSLRANFNKKKYLVVFIKSRLRYNNLILLKNSPSNKFSIKKGDSGGPLSVKFSNQSWYVVGLTSFGHKCGEESVFTKTGYFHEWIKNVKKYLYENLRSHVKKLFFKENEFNTY